MFHKLRCIKGRVAQAAGLQLIPDGTEAGHVIAPDRAVIGVREAGALLSRSERLVALALDPDQMRVGDDDGVQPGMPAAGPREAQLGFESHFPPGPGSRQTRQGRQSLGSPEELAEGIDCERRRAFRACELAALDLVSDGRVQGVEDLPFWKVRQETQRLTGHW